MEELCLNLLLVPHQEISFLLFKRLFFSSGISKDQLSAIAFTRGPGLMGSLLVGVSFAKALAYARGIPLIEVNSHAGSYFGALHRCTASKFPFICLTVSGGHTQLVLVKDHLDRTVIGETQDDAVGEAFDKTAKLLGLPYPGGPLIDRHAKNGNPKAFTFPHHTNA